MGEPTTSTGEEREFAPLIGASLPAGDVPSRVIVVPWGTVESAAGTFVVDEEAGRMVTEAFAAHGTDLPIDFEHQTLGGTYASPRGTAPAAGWITGIEVVPHEGLAASVNWTAEAEQMLREKQYRYLSPVAIIRRSDRKLIALHSVALTNKPAIVGMTAIVNRREGADDLGCDGPVRTLCAKLELADDAAIDEVLVAAGERIDALDTECRRRAAEEALAAAESAGKLTAPQRPWALQLALRDRALFDAWLATAPVVVPPGVTEPPTKDQQAGTRRHDLSARAQAEYEACATLQAVTSEEAYVADALRHRAV